ncbi:MAG: ABC transporter permease [Micropruina sp.]
MIQQVLGRVGIFAVSLLGASAVIFLVCSALPGDIAQIMLGEGADPAALAALRAELGTDRPAVVRYGEWVAGMAGGDFGVSYLTRTPVANLLAPRVGVTLWLVGFSMGLAVLIALPLGMLAAQKQRHWQGLLASSLAQVGMAIPAFWAGIILVLVFAVSLRWLPANGYVPLRTDPLQWALHLVLPTVALAGVQAAVLVRYVRSAFIEVLAEDYYRTARSIGWTPWKAMLRHGLRNAALSLVTVVGLQLSSVLVGAIIVESVFALPGLGSLLLSAVAQRDLMVIQGTVMFLVLAVLVINFLVDLSYLVIDPRLRPGVSR